MPWVPHSDGKRYAAKPDVLTGDFPVGRGRALSFSWPPSYEYVRKQHERSPDKNGESMRDAKKRTVVKNGESPELEEAIGRRKALKRRLHPA